MGVDMWPELWQLLCSPSLQVIKALCQDAVGCYNDVPSARQPGVMKCLGIYQNSICMLQMLDSDVPIAKL